MSKKHDREYDIIERLERENRQLKSTVRSLLRQVKKINRGYHKLREEDKIEEKDVPKEVNKICYECGGNYKEIIIINRRFRKCQNCGKQGKVTILNVGKETKKTK